MEFSDGGSSFLHSGGIDIATASENEIVPKVFVVNFLRMRVACNFIWDVFLLLF